MKKALTILGAVVGVLTLAGAGHALTSTDVNNAGFQPLRMEIKEADVTLSSFVTLNDTGIDDLTLRVDVPPCAEPRTGNDASFRWRSPMHGNPWKESCRRTARLPKGHTPAEKIQG